MQTEKIQNFKIISFEENEKGLYYHIETPYGTKKVKALSHQGTNPIPKYIFCKQVIDHETNNIYYTQNLNDLFPEIYNKYNTYSFSIYKRFGTNKNGIPLYIVYDNYGSHIYTDTNMEIKNSTTDIKCKVEVMQKADCSYYLKFIRITDFETFTPKSIFEAIGHSGLYENYYANLEDLISDIEPDDEQEYQEHQQTFNIMREKVENKEKIWIFDYIKLITYIGKQWGSENLDILYDVSILTRAFEEWMLNESGLLKSFSPEKREKTTLHAESTIQWVETTIHAINLIKIGKSKEFLTDILAKIRKSGYIKDQENTLAVVFKLMVIDASLFDSMEELSELIEYKGSEIARSGMASRIVHIFENKINDEIQRINQLVHFQRIEAIDRKEISPLIIGLGTLLNLPDDVITIRRLKKPYTLLATMCKYLTYITNKDTAKSLLNKALSFQTLPTCKIQLDGNILRNISKDADSLIKHIQTLNSPTQTDVKIHSIRNICITYQHKDLIVSPVPIDRHNLTISTIHSIYNIPGTSLNIGTFDDKATKWDLNSSIIYYKNRWKLLLNTSDHTINQHPKVTIKISNQDPNSYPQLIFCRLANSIFPISGVIKSDDFTNHLFSIDNMHDYFKPGMIFEAEQIYEDGKYHFNICNKLFEFSRRTIKENNSCQLAMCLNYNYHKKWAIFITESGQICESVTPGRNIEINKSYVVCFKDEYSAIHSDLPEVNVMADSNNVLDKNQLISTLLTSISKTNIPTEEGAEKGTALSNNLLYVIDGYIRLTENRPERYNLYHIARLVALSENQEELADYYATCLQYMEAESNLIVGKEDESFSFSYNPDMTKREITLKKFPSLINIVERHGMLIHFGEEDDWNYLYNIATNISRPKANQDIAKISLAMCLVQSLSQETQPIQNELKKILAKSLDIQEIDEMGDMIIDTMSNASYSFGLENQIQEYKTSIIHPAGGTERNDERQIWEIMRQIAGFLNAKGGTLYIGIDDKSRKPKGIENDLTELNYNEDEYERYIHKHIVKHFGKNINGLIQIDFPIFREKTICRITIPHYHTPVTIIKYNSNEKVFYQRQGNETRTIEGDDLIPFIQHFNDREFDAYSSANEQSPTPIILQNTTSDDISNHSDLIVSTNIETNVSNEFIADTYITEAFSKFSLTRDKSHLLDIYNKCTGKNIPIIRNSIETLIKTTNDKNLLWEFIIQFLSIDSTLFRLPIYNALTQKEHNEIYDSSTEAHVNELVKLLFKSPDAITQDINLIYLFKDQCDFSIPQHALSYTKKISTEETYWHLFEMMNFDFKESLEYLASESTPVSIFSLSRYFLKPFSYQPLHMDSSLYKDHTFLRYLLSIIDEKDLYIKCLTALLYEHLDHGQATHNEIYRCIVNNDFKAFNSYCTKKIGKVHRNRTISQLDSLTGTWHNFIVAKRLKNHYKLSLQSTDIIAFLPIKYANIASIENPPVIKAQVIVANQEHEYLIVSQTDIKETNKITDIPIYEKGDQVLIRYCRTATGITPYIAGGFSLKNGSLKVIGQSHHFDYKLKYKAEIEQCTGPENIIVKIICPIEDN